MAKQSSMNAQKPATQRRWLWPAAALALVCACALAYFLWPKTETEVYENPTATIKMADGGEIVLELYPNIAPNTVANFIQLANDGYYDGLIFHRVIEGFMIQGGCPNGTGTGGPGYAIKGEFRDNGFENALLHTRGVISMARSKANDSAGSQFFIMHADAPHLDGGYAAFGRVTSGMEVVDAIAATPVDITKKPYTAQTIASIRVDTHGATYKLTKIGG